VGTRRQSFLGVSVVEGDLPELAKVDRSRGRSGAVADGGGQLTRHYGSGANRELAKVGGSRGRSGAVANGGG
jgi:hypothetical protein